MLESWTRLYNRHLLPIENVCMRKGGVHSIKIKIIDLLQCFYGTILLTVATLYVTDTNVRV